MTNENARPEPGAVVNREFAVQFTAPWNHYPHEPLTAEDRADLDVLIAAAERGFRLATRCRRCNQWLVAPSSIRAHMGAVCRSKAGVY
jgi:uncharacterized protein DUF6011